MKPLTFFKIICEHIFLINSFNNLSKKKKIEKKNIKTSWG